MAKAKKRVVKKAKAKSTKRKVKVLPRKMSALIKIALRDMRKAEASSKFMVSMDDWYTTDQQLYISTSDQKVVAKDGTACLACAAGSVMAFSLKLGPNANKSALNKTLYGANREQLEAIDLLRCGEVVSAAQSLGLLAYSWDERPEDDQLRQTCADLNSRIPQYDGLCPELFHDAMEELQAKLEKAGL